MDSDAFLLVITGAVFFALYNIFTKSLLKAEWKDRASFLVALHQGGAAVVLFIATFATGGPQIQPGFLFPMIAHRNP